MIYFYLFALVPVLIGTLIWYKTKTVVLQEWLVGSGIALFVALIFNIIAIAIIRHKTSDIETWSGQVIRVEHHPAWVEKWQQSHTKTVGSGKNEHTITYYTTEYDHHSETWLTKRSFGEVIDSVTIDKSLYLNIKKLLGNTILPDGTQSTDHWGGKHYSGDNNIYATDNTTGYIYPCTVEKTFENRIKGAPNIFQFAKLPETISIFPYPKNGNWTQSDRLVGTANQQFNILFLDQLNARLGSVKKVNLILVGFGDKDEMYGQYLQSAWLGGKKNDLIVAYGGGTEFEPASWVYVFGWTESELVKRNIETLFLNNPITDDILPKLEEEIRQNYEIKDWHKFDYIEIALPAWVYPIYFLITIAIQIGVYIHFHQNEFTKNSHPEYDRL